MPQSNEGILLLIGALFLLLGLLGGGFEISAVKIPPVGKYTRLFAFIIGTIVFGLGMLRLLIPAPQPIPVAIVPTALPTTAPTENSPSPLPPTATHTPASTPTPNVPTLPAPTESITATTLPVSAIIQDVWVDYDQTRFQKLGMVIHVKFNITGMKSREGRATAYFSYRSGEDLKDTNGEFNTTAGTVSAGESFTPGYDVTQYDNLEIFMPYDELELGTGKYELKFHIEIWERAHPEQPALAVSPSVNFDFTK